MGIERVHVVGSGKLAKAVLDEFKAKTDLPVVEWSRRELSARSVVVHAGSGRELPEVVRFCEESGSTLFELSTGSVTISLEPSFPLVVCPNVAILLVKFLHLMEMAKGRFQEYSITIEESHQASKTSVPGTAVEIARALGVPESAIVSHRDPAFQASSLGIPTEHLGRHAYHRIRIQDGDAELVFETRILGHEPYARGVAGLVAELRGRPLSPGRHDVVEFVRDGWI